MAGKDRKLVDSTHVIPKRRGNGIVRREVWADARGRVTRYNLAYINHRLFAGDNGRVLGYDNAHDGHHCHRYGEVTQIRFASFEEIEILFDEDLIELLREAQK
jgi:hypothetical protein